MAWTEEIELAAAHGEPMPDGLTAPERTLYIALRGLYYQYRVNLIDQQDEKCREKSRELWRRLPHDLMKSERSRCQEVGKIIYGLR